MSQVLQSDPPLIAAPSGPIEVPLSPLSRDQASFSKSADDSLFERLAWLYVFFRERIFRDDTHRIVRSLWPAGKPPAGTHLLELGCGPGFYSCQLASRFPEITVVGIDCSVRQVECAREKAEALRLTNCCFEADNVMALSHEEATFDKVIGARLFTVLPDREQAISEMFRVLRPGGHCFIAEPRYAIWASLPLFAMWVLAGLTGMNNGCREPRKATVLSGAAFEELFASQPWRKLQTWQDGRYQYALCEKG